METHLFGTLEVGEDQVYRFPEGLYGFEELRRFVLIEATPGAPWKWLQSLDEPRISFVILDPFVVCPDYQPGIPAAELAPLGLETANEAAVYVLATVPADLARTTVNLRAPLVFNPKARLGRQIILPDDRYQVRHPAFSRVGAGEPGQGKTAPPVTAIVVDG